MKFICFTTTSFFLLAFMHAAPASSDIAYLDLVCEILLNQCSTAIVKALRNLLAKVTAALATTTASTTTTTPTTTTASTTTTTFTTTLTTTPTTTTTLTTTTTPTTATALASSTVEDLYLA